MALTVPQAHDAGREHGRHRAERTYSPHLPYASFTLVARAETRRALLWMAQRHPLPSFMHKDAYAHEFFDEFYRCWQRQRTIELKRTRRRAAASLFT